MSGARGEADPTVPWPGPGDGRRQVHLVGFMGSGKSTVGARLARLLLWNFLDLDVLVERHAGATVAEIFASGGEDAFRALEAHALRQAVHKPRTVVALGGGTFVAEDNRRLSAERAVSVWLDCSLEVAIRRIGAGDDQRPLWQEPEALAARYRQRRDTYALADIRVDADRDAESVARDVGERLRRI